jgi:hypothetical protein
VPAAGGEGRLVDEEMRRLLLIAAALAVNGHALRRDYARVCSFVAVLTPILFFVWNGIQPLPSDGEFTSFLAGALCMVATLGALVAAVIGLPFVLWRKFGPHRARRREPVIPSSADASSAVARRAAAFSLGRYVSIGLLWALIAFALALASLCTDGRRTEDVRTDHTDYSVQQGEAK